MRAAPNLRIGATERRMSVFHSITFKVFGIGFLALLMLIPLAEVQGLIGERNGLRERTIATIAQSYGGQQQVGGPVLAVPKTVRVQIGNSWTTQESTTILLPDRLDVAGALAPELRSYGIYAVPVYTAEIELSGRFIGADLKSVEGGDVVYHWDRAELRLPIADAHGIRRIGAVTVGGVEYAFGPGEAGVGNVGAISAHVDAKPGEDLPFRIALTLAGTQSLSVLPLAR